MTTVEPFVELHLYGDRFRDHRLPVHALVELVAYQDLLVEVAKGLYRTANPSRVRLPAGFSRSLQLTLGEVRDGCVTSVLERPVLSPEPLPSLADDVLGRAQTVVEQAILAAAAGHELPEDFPPAARLYFGRFGRTLRAGDFIQLRAPHAPGGVDYTPQVRRRLMPGPTERFLAETEIVGTVTRMDKSSMTAILELDAGGSVACLYEDEHFDVIHAALTPGEGGPKLRISGIAVHDHNRRPERITSIASIERASRADERLDEITALVDGWMGEGIDAPAPTAEAVEAARSLAHRLEPFDLHLRLYPSTEGGVSLQWKSGEWLVSVDVGNDLSAEVLIVHAATGEDRLLELPLVDEDQIVGFVRDGAAW